MVRRTLLLLLAAALCLAACKTEPDLTGDPHVPLVNPFIGVWKADTGGNTIALQYWQFRPDGTGGRAATQAGPFPDKDDVQSFSFLFFDGKGTQAAPPSLVILEGSPVTVTRYEFTIAHNMAALTPGGGGGGLILEQISGEPQVLTLTNQLIGEWSADWSSGGEHGAFSTWSIKYYTDGAVKVFHHGVGHQFENAYALRENTLVIYGAWRFGIAPVIAELGQQGDGTWQLTETQTNPGPADWVYTKVEAAQWL